MVISPLRLSRNRILKYFYSSGLFLGAFFRDESSDWGRGDRDSTRPKSGVRLRMDLHIVYVHQVLDLLFSISLFLSKNVMEVVSQRVIASFCTSVCLRVVGGQDHIFCSIVVQNVANNVATNCGPVFKKKFDIP